MIENLGLGEGKSLLAFDHSVGLEICAKCQGPGSNGPMRFDPARGFPSRGCRFSTSVRKACWLRLLALVRERSHASVRVLGPFLIVVTLITNRPLCGYVIPGRVVTICNGGWRGVGSDRTGLRWRFH